MSTSKNRRLAAILFVDIVGYTAFMQKDEITANQNLKKFHQTPNKKVSPANPAALQNLVGLIGVSFIRISGVASAVPNLPIKLSSSTALE